MRIFVLGCGKMGSWIANELGKNNEIALYDTDQAKTAKISNAKVLAKLEDVKEFAPELLINAVSLQNTINAFESVLGYLPKECVICDVASVKADLPAFYGSCNLKFASVHPMFGPTFANVQSLKDESAIVIKEGDEKTRKFMKEFFSLLGIKVFEYTFKEHDDMMAYSLTTPFAASMVFAACVDKTAVPGTTFARHKALAKGLLSEEDNLLAEILFNNRSLAQLDKITARLEFLKHIIKAKDYEEAKRFFDNLRKNIE